MYPRDEVPTLRFMNVSAIALVLVAWADRERPRAMLRWLALAAVADLYVLFTLMSERAVVAQTAAGLDPIQMIHVLASSLFPLFYPFVLAETHALPEPSVSRPARLPAGFLAFVAFRAVGFVTSYFMGA